MCVTFKNVGMVAETFKGISEHKRHFGSQSNSHIQSFYLGFPQKQHFFFIFEWHGRRKPDRIRKFQFTALCSWRRSIVDGVL